MVANTTSRGRTRLVATTDERRYCLRYSDQGGLGRARREHAGDRARLLPQDEGPRADRGVGGVSSADDAYALMEVIASA